MSNHTKPKGDMDLSDFYTFDINPSKTPIDDQLFALNQENKKNYSLITFLTSKKKPDIYYQSSFISGMNYMNKKQERDDGDEKKTGLEDDDDNEDDIELKEGGRYQDMKNMNVRYYNFSQNITIKCFNCGQIGHMSRSCPVDHVLFCIKCNRNGHEDRECSITKCFKCNQYGHRSGKCPKTKANLTLCTRCQHIGHKEDDCLINPYKINKNILAYNGLSCSFCGSHEHLICHFDRKKEPVELISDKYSSNAPTNNDTESPNDLSEEGEVPIEKPIFQSITNYEISECNFCPRCAGKHKMKYCQLEDKRNDFDEKRLQFSKYIFGHKNNDYYR